MDELEMLRLNAVKRFDRFNFTCCAIRKLLYILNYI